MTWTRAVERVANTAKDQGGNVILVALRRFPALALVYATAISAVHRQNYGPLRAVTADVAFRSLTQSVPLIADMHPYKAFDQGDIASNVLAMEAEGEEVGNDLIITLRSGRTGKRYTPVSDLLHGRLRPYFADLIPDDHDYGATFDRVEVLLGALARDQELVPPEDSYVRGAWFGRFTWHHKGRISLQARTLAEATVAGAAWPPVQAGLFGGASARAEAALESFAKDADRVRGW